MKKNKSLNFISLLCYLYKEDISNLNWKDYENKADLYVLTLKSLEAFAKAADGRATKIIIPSELQGIAGLTKTIAEVARPDKAAE